MECQCNHVNTLSMILKNISKLIIELFYLKWIMIYEKVFINFISNNKMLKENLFVFEDDYQNPYIFLIILFHLID